jgi:hypothetical protein
VGSVDQLSRLNVCVDYNSVPASSGLPQLPLPRRAPTSNPLRFILAVVLYKTSQRTTGHISQRELQAILNRSGRDPIQNHLHQLRVSKFLSRKDRRKDLSDADVYYPGTHIRGNHLEEWKELSQKLFHTRGLCNKLLQRPAFGTGFLNQNGMLITGTLLKSKRPLKVKEIHDYLSFFISDEGTIRSRLKMAQQHGLVLQEGAAWAISTDFWNQLENYEHLQGPKSRQERLSHRISGERIQFAIDLRHGKITPADEAALRKQGCIRCGKSNEQHVAETDNELQLEHFPPQKWLKAWGYKDHLDFNWAICASGNNKYSHYIKKRPAPQLDKSIQASFSPDADISRAVLASLETAIQKFYRFIDKRQYGEASKIALRAFLLWASTIPQHSATDDAKPVHMFITPLTDPLARRTRRTRRVRRILRAGTPVSAKSRADRYADTGRTNGSKRR